MKKIVFVIMIACVTLSVQAQDSIQKSKFPQNFFQQVNKTSSISTSLSTWVPLASASMWRHPSATMCSCVPATSLCLGSM